MNIIPLPRDPHRETQMLLPWYATGRLDASDQAMVEAHMGVCAECQSELKLEHGLGAEVSALPADVDEAWAGMLHRIRADQRGRAASLAVLGEAASRLWRRSAPGLGWASAAALALVLTLGSMSPRTQERSGPYHALSAAPPSPAGNVVVIFRPETSETGMRQALRAANARLVDGPTAADAYVLHVPAAGRARALATLRSRSAVVLAEPIDAGELP